VSSKWCLGPACLSVEWCAFKLVPWNSVSVCGMVCLQNGVGLDWIELDWIGSDRIGLNWIGSDRIGSDRIGSDRIGSDRIGSD
jgi:hypothetical protein